MPAGDRLSQGGLGGVDRVVEWLRLQPGEHGLLFDGGDVLFEFDGLLLVAVAGGSG